MKKLSPLAFLAAAGVALSISAPADAAWVCDLKKGQQLSLRACANTSCRVKDTHSNGTKLDALKSSGTNWIYVKVKRTGRKGWMKEPYLCGDDIDFG